MGRNDPNRNRKAARIALLCIAGYLALLVLMVLTERTDPGASINSLTDALWYSVVTISTVGYGDLYPVTPLGRILGFCFVLMSVGVLSFLISAMIGFFTGNLMPALKRRAMRNKNWYVFSEVNEASLALAEDLLKQEECLCLFPKNQEAEIPGHIPCACYDSMEKLLGEKADGCQVLCMNRDMDSNYPQALKLLELGHPVYCSTQQAPDRCPDGLTVFNHYDCCAREYWHSRALGTAETTVVLIGDGQYAQQLLTRGMQMNLFSDKQQIRYHLFGDWANYRRNHHQLGITMAIDTVEPGKDSLLFHEENWNADGALLAEADRILVCGDNAGENLRILRQLRLYFPVAGQVHVRSEVPVPEETVFGNYKTTCTAELVLQSALTKTARTMHEIYQSGADYPVPGWSELSEFTRQSNISAADHLLTKVRLLLEDESIHALTPEVCARAFQRYQEQKEEKADFFRALEHLRWMRFHSIYNWCYGPSRNNPKRIHPLMLPYDLLTPEDQRKDDYAWELLGELMKK